MPGFGSFSPMSNVSFSSLRFGRPGEVGGWLVRPAALAVLAVLVALVVLVAVGVVLVAPVLAAALLVVAGGRPAHPPAQPYLPSLWPTLTFLSSVNKAMYVNCYGCMFHN